jgi:hypothetical protein
MVRLSGARIMRRGVRSELNQRQYCESQGIPLKAFGNWRAKLKAEPQLPERKLLYRRRSLSQMMRCDPVRALSEVARHYGIAARVLFRWKQELTPPAAPMFVAVQITDANSSSNEEHMS